MEYEDPNWLTSLSETASLILNLVVWRTASPGLGLIGAGYERFICSHNASLIRPGVKDG